MREIKFRAWDREKKLMHHKAVGPHEEYYADHLSLINGWLSSNMEEPEIDDEGEIWPRFAYMQYTGLKDKNGKEIYEGDIVSDHVGVGVVRYAEIYAAFMVVYGDGRAKWFYDYSLKGERESIEVIGNIHENPELLEQQ